MALISRIVLAVSLCVPSIALGASMRTTWYETGRGTASGIPFNADNPTICAHRTLRLGTLLKITNHRNGATVFAWVMDRGPVSKALDLDVSRGVAKLLGIIKQGVATLDVVVVQ